MKFETVGTEIVYQGRALTIRRDRVRLPDERIADWDVVQHNGSVILIPLDDQGNIYFVRQYRHAAGLDLLELPAGTREPGEDPLACATREIREETGMAADRIEKIGAFYLAPGYSTELMHVFMATQLRPDPLKGDDDEFLSVETLPAAEALRRAESGEFPDCKSLAALLLARSHLPGA